MFKFLQRLIENASSTFIKEVVLYALKNLAARTDNTIDDAMVNAFEKYFTDDEPAKAE